MLCSLSLPQANEDTVIDDALVDWANNERRALIELGAYSIGGAKLVRDAGCAQVWQFDVDLTKLLFCLLII